MDFAENHYEVAGTVQKATLYTSLKEKQGPVSSGEDHQFEINLNP